MAKKGFMEALSGFAPARWAHRQLKRVIKRKLRRQGYTDYMANEWFDSVRKNLMYDKETPLKTKLWCYKRGFMPWRIPQYGLTNENYKEFLSDRDYMYLHQINNSYKKWIEDKMTFRYVFEPFKEFLPKYYFHLIRRQDDKENVVILPLPDCPEGYEPTFDDVLRLLRDKKMLALKTASGTHGIGFYKLEYRDDGYWMNLESVTEDDIIDTMKSINCYYIITEYVEMHPDLKKIYVGSVNTIRILMINRDGLNPCLADAYMRIGSVKSGVTDNVAYGGVVAKINMETGELYSPETIVNHVFTPCPIHPDTGTEIGGILPNWDIVKETIIKMCKYFGQLEYLGFDVAITKDGFQLLEVNSHQDLHRYPLYDQRVKDFFKEKLEAKNERNRRK